MKKRLSALVVAICLIATCLPFSAIVSADTPVSDGVAGYIVKAPADKDSAASGDLASDALLDVAGQAITVRHENGENFFVIDEAISTKGNTTTDVVASFYAQGMNVAGLPSAMGITDTSVIAIRVKFNENSPAYDTNKFGFKVLLGAAGGAVADEYSEKINTERNVDVKWLDLVDATCTAMFPSSGSKGTADHAVDKFEFKGDLDGYMLIPISAFGDEYTAAQLKSYFSALTIAPQITNANDDNHEVRDPVTDTLAAFTLRNRELLIGDIAIVNDLEAFKAAKTAGITKYSTGLDDGAVIAQVNRGYKTQTGENYDTYVIPELGKNANAPLKPNTGFEGVYHLTTLPNGDMAYGVKWNDARPYVANKFVYTTNINTFEGLNTTGAYDAANYTTNDHFKGIVKELGIGPDTGYAVRVALTGNEGKTVHLAIGVCNKKDQLYYQTVMAGSVVTFIDANTGETKEYTVQKNTVAGENQFGIALTGNIDGYFITKNTKSEYFNNCGSNIDLNSFRGVGATLWGKGWNQGQTLYLGNGYWVKDFDKFVATRTSCDVVGHDFQTKSVTPANCTEPKKYNQECSRCDATNVVTEGEALGHTWGAPTIVEADCVNGGYDLYKCTVAGCGVEKKENETQAKGHGHKEGLVEQKADPGLHTPGSTVTYCGDCGDIIKEASVIEPTCKETETKLINVKAATCKEDGYTGDKVCVACETVIEKGKVDPKLPHTEKTVNAKEATCKEAGYTGDVVCDVCKEEIKKGEATDKLPHTEKTVNAKEATCKEAGYTGDVVCDVCDEEIKKGEAVAKLDHTYGDWEETKAPTATEKGEKERECSACGDVEKAEIPATGTATGDGNNEGGNANKPSSPNTGDNNSILWVVLMAITAGAVLTVVAKKRCK